jgi:hypothetical protein
MNSMVMCLLAGAVHPTPSDQAGERPAGALHGRHLKEKKTLNSFDQLASSTPINHSNVAVCAAASLQLYTRPAGQCGLELTLNQVSEIELCLLGACQNAQGGS